MTKAMHPEYKPATPFVWRVFRMIAIGLSLWYPVARAFVVCHFLWSVSRQKTEAYLSAELRPRLHVLGRVRDEPAQRMRSQTSSLRVHARWTSPRALTLRPRPRSSPR